MKGQNQWKHSYPLYSHLLRELGKEAVTSQAELKNPDLARILYSFSDTLTYCILKSLDSNILSDIYSINTPYTCLHFPACDVTAWTSELKHWISTGEN